MGGLTAQADVSRGRHIGALVAFVAVALLIPWTLGPLRPETPIGDGAYLLLFALVAASPTIAWVVAGAIEGWQGADRLSPRFDKWRLHLVGAVIPIVVAIVYLGILSGTRITHLPFASEVTFPSFGSSPFAWLRFGFDTWFILGLAFLEEIGWRGYLQFRLVRGHPLISAIGTGIIWNYWHYEMIFSDPGLFLFRYPGPQLLDIAVTTALAIIFAWLTMRSGSIWPATWAHASYNLTIGFGGIAATASLTSASNIILLALLGSIATMIVVSGGLSPEPRRRGRTLQIAIASVAAVCLLVIGVLVFELRRCSDWNDELRSLLDAVNVGGDQTDLVNRIFEIRTSMDDTRPLFCEAES